MANFKYPQLDRHSPPPPLSSMAHECPCPWHVHISPMALHNDDDGLLNVNVKADAAVIVGSLGCAFPAANGPSPHELMVCNMFFLNIFIFDAYF
jgi:hypothetical protein